MKNNSTIQTDVMLKQHYKNNLEDYVKKHAGEYALITTAGDGSFATTSFYSEKNLFKILGIERFGPPYICKRIPYKFEYKIHQFIKNQIRRIL